jgi:hypothetical protein
LVNVIQFFIALTLTLGAAIGGYLMRGRGWGLTLLGSAFGGMAAFGSLRIAAKVVAVWERDHPWLPVCRNGVCGPSDYTISPMGSTMKYVCKCGIAYVRNFGRFDELSDDGTTKPYLRRSPLGRWLPTR